MDARAVALFLLPIAAFGCNGDDRDAQAMSGTAGLSSAGEGSTSGATPDPDDVESTSSGASGSTTGDATAASTGVAEETGDGSTEGSTSGGTTTDETTSGGESSSGGESDSSGIVDGVLDIGIIAHNDCTFTVEPASITVPEGTEFTVNWISAPSSEVEFDIAKIDPFNQVPIVIGMEPGTSYHDEIREWCGTLFTGMFEFRLTSCYDPLYIPVDCGG